MGRVVHGVIHGKTIQLADDPGIADGQEVRVVLAAVPAAAAANWGDGIRRSAGGWADDPEIEAVMARIQEDRRLERRPQAPQ